jgi:hypothetical protein
MCGCCGGGGGDGCRCDCSCWGVYVCMYVYAQELRPSGRRTSYQSITPTPTHAPTYPHTHIYIYTHTHTPFGATAPASAVAALPLLVLLSCCCCCCCITRSRRFTSLAMWKKPPAFGMWCGVLYVMYSVHLWVCRGWVRVVFGVCVWGGGVGRWASYRWMCNQSRQNRRQTRGIGTKIFTNPYDALHPYIPTPTIPPPPPPPPKKQTRTNHPLHQLPQGRRPLAAAAPLHKRHRGGGGGRGQGQEVRLEAHAAVDEREFDLQHGHFLGLLCGGVGCVCLWGGGEDGRGEVWAWKHVRAYIWLVKYLCSQSHTHA